MHFGTYIHYLQGQNHSVGIDCLLPEDGPALSKYYSNATAPLCLLANMSAGCVTTNCCLHDTMASNLNPIESR